MELEIDNSSSRELLVRCLTLYEGVRDKRYAETRPKLKLDEMQKDDDWRYNELPNEAAEAGCLTKAQLARLIKWKITHGVHRPFLPGMIQKNIEEDVGRYTAIAAEQLQSLSINDELDDIVKTAENALKDACNLKGVGPATGSLVLSIFAPDVIPFFEDELFRWLVPEHKTKLKYDKKEYGSMLRPALDLMTSQSITAREVEKIAYVVVHSQYLDNKQRESLKE